MGFSDPVHYTDGDIEAAYVSMVEFLDNSLSVSYKRVGRDGTTSSTVLDEMEVKDGNGMLVRTIRFYITPYNDNNFTDEAGFGAYIFTRGGRPRMVFRLWRCPSRALDLYDLRRPLGVL